MRPDEQPDLDFDPWEDTTAERPVEHEDPFDDGTTDGPLGVHAEAIGVPRLSAGTRKPRLVANSMAVSAGWRVTAGRRPSPTVSVCDDARAAAAKLVPVV